MNVGRKKFERNREVFRERSRDPESSHKAFKIQCFREGRVRGPASRMASQKRFQRNSEGLKVLKKVIKYTTFVIFMKNERSVEQIEVKSRERKSSQKAYKLKQFRQGWVGERCETHELLGDSGKPESGQKGCEL